MPHVALGRLLVAGLILALLGVGGSMVGNIMPTGVDMRIEPAIGTRVVGEEFTVAIVVESDEPVNVFKGNMLFDADLLQVTAIDYNTSIADLWAERPWFENGEGTLNFVGGTTRQGGFVGLGTLITVTFKTKETGSATITMDEVRILRHDGLGSDATVAEPIDAIFTVSEEEIERQTVLAKSAVGPKVNVLPEIPKTDLNDDGKQNVADVSIFMQHMLTQNLRSDFNKDGSVGAADLSIILDAK